MLDSSNFFLENTKNTKPDIAVILGSGLTNFFDQKDVLYSISYEKLSGFPQPSVQGHTGKLELGSLFNKKVVCMYGRSHIYEGHDPSILTNPIRFLKDIGCKLLIITNAAGSLNKDMPAGSLMAISDHINWSGYNPLIGENNDSYGPRFPDMSDAYNQYYRDQIKETDNIQISQ